MRKVLALALKMTPNAIRPALEAPYADKPEVRIEQLENALNVVLDELDNPVSEDSSIVLVNRYRVCGDIAQALGVLDD